MRLLLSVLFLFPFLISLSSCQNCDAGWIDDGDQSCFKFDREVGNPTWSEALGYCIGQHAGAFLAEIRNQNQQSFVERWATSLGSTNDQWWIGLSDLAQEGTYVWANSGDTATNFTAWAAGEPNGGTSEDCVHLIGYYGFRWNDNDCNQAGRWPLCQYYYVPASTAAPKVGLESKEEMEGIEEDF